MEIILEVEDRFLSRHFKMMFWGEQSIAKHKKNVEKNCNDLSAWVGISYGICQDIRVQEAFDIAS